MAGGENAVLGILYIILCMLCGCALCSLLFKNLKKPAEDAGLPAFLVQLPAWYLTGTLAVTWLVYLTAYLFQKKEEPLYYANLIVAILTVIFIAVVAIK